MKLKTVLVIAGLVATAGAVSAIAAVGDREGGPGMRWGKGGQHGGMMGHGRHGGGFGRLMQLDTDKDGDVTLAEFLKPHEARFAELDANKDGVVDAAELTAHFKAKANDRIDGMLKRLDANGDGKISREEFALASAGGMGHGRHNGGWGRHGHHRMGMMDEGPGPMRGERMRRGGPDTGSDAGKAGETQPPSKSAEAQPGQAGQAPDGERRGWRGRHRWGGEEGRGERRGGGRAQFVAAVEGRFKALDKNGDGFIDKAELETAQAEEIDYRVKRMLHTLDRNKDGKITAEEFLAPAKERFARLDLNDDGKISSDDMPPSRRASWSKR